MILEWECPLVNPNTLQCALTLSPLFAFTMKGSPGPPGPKPAILAFLIKRVSVCRRKKIRPWKNSSFFPHVGDEDTGWPQHLHFIF